MNRSCRPYPSAFVTIGKKALLMSVVVSAIGSASQAQHAELGRAASVLKEISAISRNGVPDAVLNSTKCVVVIPSAKGEAPSVSARGVVTCRDTRDGWSAPAYVKFSGRGVRARSPDFLVFVLSDKG